MKFDVSEQDSRRAKIPHEIFLTNLIGNHILWFIASLGLFNSYWQPLALVPIFSVSILGYILWRARCARQEDHWFVMCHWQISATRSRLFLYMVCFLCLISLLGWLGYTYLGMMKVAVFAMIGGIGLLPVMVVVLGLILMESDMLHQAAQKRLPEKWYQKYPNNEVRVLLAEETA